MLFADSKGLKLGKITLTVLSLGLLSPKSALTADFDVVVSADGLVSMRGQNVAVKDIMNSLGAELNIAISFPTPVTDTVNVDFQELKLEQAIKQVTQSYIIVTSGKSKGNAIKEIIVMPEGESSAYLPEEGELKQLLVQDGGESAVSPVEDQEREARRLEMLRRVAEIKARTQVEVEEARRVIELEEQMGGIPTPAEMD